MVRKNILMRTIRKTSKVVKVTSAVSFQSDNLWQPKQTIFFKDAVIITASVQYWLINIIAAFMIRNTIIAATTNAKTVN